MCGRERGIERKIVDGGVNKTKTKPSKIVNANYAILLLKKKKWALHPLTSVLHHALDMMPNTWIAV